MNVQFTVSAKSFSLDPNMPFYATNGSQTTLKRLDKFNDNLEFKTPDGLSHTITKGHIYLIEDSAYECHEDTPNRSAFGIRMSGSLPPLDWRGIKDWQNRHPAQFPALSEYATKLETFASEHLEKFPGAMSEACMNHAVYYLEQEYGRGKEHLTELALRELAARWIFRARN